jgi:hypothetical protein
LRRENRHFHLGLLAVGVAKIADAHARIKSPRRENNNE